MTIPIPDFLIKVGLILIIMTIMILILLFGSVPMKKGKIEVKIARWNNLGTLGGVICVLVLLNTIGFIPAIFFALGSGLVYRSIIEIMKLNFERNKLTP